MITAAVGVPRQGEGEDWLFVSLTGSRLWTQPM